MEFGKMNAAVRDILGHQGYDAFVGGGPVKSGLPAAAYTSQEFFDLEMKTVFANGWTFVGFAHEVAGPGDIMPSRAGAAPIILVRDLKGNLQAFHNICRHRGCELVVEPAKKKKAIVCPYHAWSYSLDGGLRRASNFGGDQIHTAEGFDPGDHGLLPVRTAVWHDWIFVNLDGHAQDFDSFIEPIAKQVAHVNLDEMVPIISMDSGYVNANWKFVCENYIEPYHVPIAHPETAAGQPLKDHYMVEDGHMVGCAIDVEEAKGDSAGTDRKVFLDFNAQYLLCFPNFLFFLYYGETTQVIAMLNTPLAPDRNHQRRVIYQPKDVPITEEEKEEWRKLNADVVREDWDMLERLQVGRNSPVMTDSGGVFSPVWEQSERAFQELILNAVESAR